MYYIIIYFSTHKDYITLLNLQTPLSNIIHTNFLPHLQPTGYVVKFVSHAKTLPSSSVGLSQQQLSTSVDNSNTEENKVNYTNNK